MPIKRSLTSALAALAAFGAAAPAQAERYPRLPTNLSHMTLGYTYFNRAGATVEQHNRDLTACFAEAAKTISADAMLNGGGQGIVGNLIAGGLASAANRGTTASALENCMLVNGWRVILVPESVGVKIAALADDKLVDRIGGLIGSAQPEGTIFRVWRNDITNSTVDRWSLRPPHNNDGFLSLRLLKIGNMRDARKASDTAPLASQPVVTSAMLKVDKAWPAARYEAASIPALPGGGAVLVMGMAGGITALELERVGADRTVRPVTIDHKPDRFRAYGKWGAYIIPAGHWRVRAVTKALLSINTCLGAPSFEVAPGDVLFGGNFNLLGVPFGPDMDLAKAKTWLGSSPLAERIKPVSWVNGSQGECGDSTIYALEFDGFPYAAGYAKGSKVGS